MRLLKRKLTYLIISIFLLVSGCNSRDIVEYELDNSNVDPENMSGLYKGTYKRILNYKQEYSFWKEKEGPVYFIFNDSTYSCWGTCPDCPLRGYGEFNIDEYKLTLIDTCSTKDKYLLDGKFEFIFQNNAFKITRYDVLNDILHNAWLEKIM